MNKWFKWILAIAILVAVPKVITKIFFGDSKGQARTAIAKIVAETNPTLPKKIDAVTTLTRVELDGQTYRVHYTMDPAVQIDPANRPVYEKTAHQQICAGNMKLLSDNGIGVEYLYTYTGAGGVELKMPVAVPAGSCAT
jgi:hypothetical protein